MRDLLPMHNGLKIHVSPVRFRLCPRKKSLWKRAFYRVFGGFFVSLKLTLSANEVPYMHLKDGAGHYGFIMVPSARSENV
jgi:hypothetical protein